MLAVVSACLYGGVTFGQTVISTVPIGIQAETWPGGCHNGTKLPCVSPEPAAATRPANAAVMFGAVVPDSWGVLCSPTGSPLSFLSTTSQLEVVNIAGAPQPVQFRCESTYTDGSAKWVLIDIQDPGFIEGGFESNYELALVTSGGGNNPASSMGTMCTGAGTPAAGCLASGDLFINTGAATFSLRPGSDNLFEQVTIGSTILVLAGGQGANDGLMAMGPSHAAVTLGTIDSVSCNPGPPPTNYAGSTVCATPYLSNLDPFSTFVFQDNGPLRTVVVAQSNLMNANGDIYMHQRKYYTFLANHTDVNVSVALRNADLSTTGSDFASAYKELSLWDARLTVNLASGSRSIVFGDPTGTTSTTLISTSDYAYLYQGFSKEDLWPDWSNTANCVAPEKNPDECVVSPILRTGRTGNWTYPQDGWQIQSTQSLVGTVSGSSATYPPGWALETDASGNGVMIGVNRFTQHWPGALEFFNGGNELRIGMKPDQTLYLPNPTSVQTYAQPWPQYSIKDLWFNFFTPATAPGAGCSYCAKSASDAFLDNQQNLVGRLPFSSYNAVLPIPIVDPVQEDTYNKAMASPPEFTPLTCIAGKCLMDVGGKGNNQTNGSSTNMYDFAFFFMAQGSANQMDFAGSQFIQFLQRGCTPSSGSCGALSLTGSQSGKLQWAKNWYRDLVFSGVVPRSDFGGWRTACTACTGILSAYGYPDQFTSWNEGMRQFLDTLDSEDHFHLEWMSQYCLYSGDQWCYEQLEAQGLADAALNPNIAYNNPSKMPPLDNPGRSPFSAVRAAGHWVGTNASTLQFLCDIHDPSVYSDGICQPSALANIETSVAYSMEAPALASGYPVGLTEPTEAICLHTFTSECSGGQNPIRGFIAVGANNNGSTDDCVGTVKPCDKKYHHVVKSFQVQPAEEGLYLFDKMEQSYRGPLWVAPSVIVAKDGNNINVVVPLSDAGIQQSILGAGEWALTENFINNASSTFSGIIYETYPGYLNSTPPCSQSSGNPNCAHLCTIVKDCPFGGENYFHWAAVGLETNSIFDLSQNSLQPAWELYISKIGSGALSEWESPEMQAVEGLILAHNPNPNIYPVNPTLPILQDIPLTVSPAGCPGSTGATCTLTFTPPAGLTTIDGTTYRLVYYTYPTSGGSPKNILNWLRFYPNCTLTYSEGQCPSGMGGLAAVDGSGFWPAGQTPDVNTPWFSATPVNDPALQSSTGTYVFTPAPGMSYVFDLKAYFPY